MTPRPRDLRRLACALEELAGDLERGHTLSSWHGDRVNRAAAELLATLQQTPAPRRRRPNDRPRKPAPRKGI